MRHVLWLNRRVIGAGLLAAALGFALLSRTEWFQDTIGWRVSALVSEVYLTIRPPSARAFTPDPTLAAMVQQTLQAYTPSATASPTAGPSMTPQATGTATSVPTPLPETVYLEGSVFEYQGLNNCGPANLAMALTFWNWQGDQRPVAAFTKPNRDDKNVMPYELAAFVEEETDLQVLLRVGGDLDLLKRLLAAGFPVLVEKGYDIARPGMGWYGHYQVVLGYDDARARFTAHDSYVGENQPVPYARFESAWRAFNFTYMVIFPPEREAEVRTLLGPASDETAATQIAAQRASDEIFGLEGRDQFFAWFNRGSSLVMLQDYAGAAAAYDQAYSLLPTLGLDDLASPWRILWYQTGPYFAYYYTGRYGEVYSLATMKLDEGLRPQLEESLYWRGLAREALGDIDGAISDLRLSLVYHPDFAPSLAALTRMGVSP
jgi:hypothetical protein